jgi:hypothetical protein
MWFVAGFGFSEDCMMLKKLKFFLALETCQLRALYMSGSPDMWTYLVFLLNKNFNFPNLKQLVLNSLH